MSSSSGIGSNYGRTVFVLDISGSMGGQKCQTLQLSVNRIIDDIPENSYVGVVLFDHITEMAHKVIQITDQTVRDRVIQSVPAMARGGTDIGSGILFGLRALTDGGICTDGATMFLVTDGEDSFPNAYVDRVLSSLLSAKIKVICIAIGNDADANMDRLARETNGKTYYASDTDRALAARVIESTLQEVKTSKELAEAINISVCDESLRLTQLSITKKVVIDGDIGRNTVFTIGSEDFDKISVEILSPNGHKYNSTSSEMNRNETLKRFQLKPKTTESGVWSIFLTKHSNQTICSNVSVKSQPLNPNAVQMKITLKDPDTNSPPIIIAELRKGKDVVIGAEVMATVDRPNGTETKVKLINYNNIYCNYFTDYCGSGRYNVSVLAQDISNTCKLKSLSARTSVNISIPLFERQLIAGCFKVTDSMPQKPSNDEKLKELSMSPTFNSISFNSSTTASFEAPAPRTARAVITPRVRAIPQTDDLKKLREKINELLFLIKKSINSSKITENDRKDMKKSMNEIDIRLSSSLNSTTIPELNGFLNKLEEYKQKLS